MLLIILLWWNTWELCCHSSFNGHGDYTVKVETVGGWTKQMAFACQQKVGGKLEDLVAVTFLQQKFKAWSTATAVGFVHLALHKSLTQLVLMTVSQLETSSWFFRSDFSQGSHACCLLRREWINSWAEDSRHCDRKIPTMWSTSQVMKHNT